VTVVDITAMEDSCQVFADGDVALPLVHQGDTLVVMVACQLTRQSRSHAHGHLQEYAAHVID
jgi:hypothetical protein